MRSILRRAVKGILIASILVVALVLLQRTTVFSDLDRLTFDLIVDHTGLNDSSTQVVFVDFDEETFQRIRQFPIPRSLFAEAFVASPRRIRGSSASMSCSPSREALRKIGTCRTRSPPRAS